MSAGFNLVRTSDPTARETTETWPGLYETWIESAAKILSSSAP